MFPTNQPSRRSRLLAGGVIVALATLPSGITAQAQQRGQAVVFGEPGQSLEDAVNAGPVDLFKGCADQVSNAARIEGNATLQNVAEQMSVKTATTTRTLAPLAYDDVPDEIVDACWKRIDGAWSADERIVLDTSAPIEGWGASDDKLKVLAHGTYRRPNQLHIELVEDSTIIVSDALEPSRSARFRPADDWPLVEAMTPRARPKRYERISGDPIATTIEVSVGASGRARLRVDRQVYIRPQPNRIHGAGSEDYGQDSPWMISYTLTNTRASLSGYDVVTQDDFYFLSNEKSPVFSYNTGYVIDEKQVVPLGFNYIPIGVHGMIYREKISTSARSIQADMRASYGLKVSASENAYVGAKAAAEVGFTLQKNNAVGLMTAHTRNKQYALVMEPALLGLSDAFVDAIDDAYRYGREDPRRFVEIVEKFGTHYPYAVTYGMAAKASKKTDAQGYAKEMRAAAELDVEAGVGAFGTGTEASAGLRVSAITSSQGSVEGTDIDFVAVGTSGGSIEGPVASATAYPILLDLRPLPELLNPLNFPGEPAKYGWVRDQLKAVIDGYLEANANFASDASLLPEDYPFHGREIFANETIVAKNTPLRRWVCIGAVPSGSAYLTAITGCSSGTRFTLDDNGLMYGAPTPGTKRLCLTRTGLGERPILDKCSFEDSQIWRFDAGRKAVRNPSSGECLDFSLGGGNRNQLITWKCNGAANQRWEP